MPETAHPFKVWTADRRQKKSVTASSLQQLIEKGRAKLNLVESSQLHVVLEEDGTEVDDEDYFTFLPVNCTLLFLVNDEQWSPRSKDVLSYDETDHMMESEVESLNETWTALAGSLRQDLSRIVTFSDEQLQELVDCDKSDLARSLGESERYAASVQSACQRHLDERSQTKEAVDLLKLYHTAQQTSNQTESKPGKKRKAENSS